MKDEFEGFNEDEHLTTTQATTLERTRMRHGSTLYFLFNVVSITSFEKIVKATLAKEASKILKVAYKGDIHVRKV